jgi:hypothetical protein
MQHVLAVAPAILVEPSTTMARIKRLNVDAIVFLRASTIPAPLPLIVGALLATDNRAMDDRTNNA